MGSNNESEFNTETDPQIPNSMPSSLLLRKQIFLLLIFRSLIFFNSVVIMSIMYKFK